jgi:hypothetical protein
MPHMHDAHVGIEIKGPDMSRKKEDPDKHRSRARAYYQRMYSPQGPRYEFYKASSLRASKDYYARNRESIRSKQEQVQQEIRTWFRQYKKNIACIRCGEHNAACLHFHHRNRSEKVRNVGYNVYAAKSLEKFIQELEKCDVLCANCHMIEHWEEWDEAAALYKYEELERQSNEANWWPRRNRIRGKLHRQRVLIWYKRYKRTLACERCGFNHPACIQFHHVGDNKDMSLSKLVYTTTNIDRIKREIGKCEVLCANCHAKQHWVEDGE